VRDSGPSTFGAEVHEQLGHIAQETVALETVELQTVALETVALLSVDLRMHSCMLVDMGCMMGKFA